MMRTATERRLAFNIVLWLLLLGNAATVPAQQPKEHQSLNYGFVSPNTRDDLKIKEAIEGMRSAQESRLIRQAINLGCVVRAQVRPMRALGSWSDGAEYSVMLRVRTNEDSVRYLLSRLGRDAQQKSVLYFHPQPKGTATVYALRPRRNSRNLIAIANTLDQAGLVFRTLVPVGKNTWIYIVDTKGELRPKVLTAAQRLRARVSSESGNAEFVGDEQVSQAKTVFEQEIKSYETRHPNLPPACDVRRRSH